MPTHSLINRARLLCTLVCGVLALVVGCRSRPPLQPAATDAVAFEQVTVLPMDGRTTLPDHTVLVQGGRITAVGPASSVTIPLGARRIDGRGKFLIPGLTDMHSHAHDEPDRLLLVANGVTQVRAIGSSREIIALSERIARGDTFGPFIYYTSELFDGAPPTWPFVASTTDASVVDGLVRDYTQRGIDQLKVYSRLSPEVFAALSEAARRHGARIVGHVPEAVGLEAALAGGQVGIEHLDGFGVTLAQQGSPAHGARYFDGKVDFLNWFKALAFMDERKLPGLVRKVVDAGAWNCPTVVLLDRAARLEDFEALRRLPGMRYVAPIVVHSWQPNFVSGATPEDFAQLRRGRDNALRVVQALHQAGAPLLPGTDNVDPFLIPGFSLIDELRLFVQAGLSPYEALHTATAGSARFLKAESDFGTIAVGRRADLVLLDANPLEDINHLDRRAGIMLRGAWLPWSELQGRLDELAAMNAGTRSRFAGSPPTPPEGERELLARYEHRIGGTLMGEERLTVDRLSDGSRVAVGEARFVGPGERVRYELGASGHGQRLRRESENGWMEVRREGGQLQAQVQAPGWPLLRGQASRGEDVLLTGPTVAASTGLHTRLMRLAPGATASLRLAVPRSELQTSFTDPLLNPARFGGAIFLGEALLLQFKPEVAVALVEQRVDAQRQPDATRTVNGRPVPVRTFTLSFAEGDYRGTATLALDEQGWLVGMSVGDQSLARVE
jgi:hypothetical protein